MLGSLHCFIYATNQLRAHEPTNTISNYEVLDQTQWLVLGSFLYNTTFWCSWNIRKSKVCHLKGFPMFSGGSKWNIGRKKGWKKFKWPCKISKPTFTLLVRADESYEISKSIDIWNFFSTIKDKELQSFTNGRHCKTFFVVFFFNKLLN